MEEQSQQVDVSDLAHSGYKQELRFAHSLEWATGVDCGPAAPACTRDGGRTLASGTAWITTHIPLMSEMPHDGSKQSGYGMYLGNLAPLEYAQITHDMASHD